MSQKILFPMQYMNITTGINEASHVGSNAIDCAGKDTGIDNVFAPFTGVIKKVYTKNGNTVWLESQEPVLYADGTIDFATVSFTHDNFVGDLKVGQVIQQGQVFYQEGTAGQASGNHLHLEIGKGKFSGTGWHLVGGKWVINNSYVPYAAFWLKDETIVKNGYGYPWKKETKMVDELQLSVLYRFLLGTEISEYGLKNRLGKQTFQQAHDDIRASAEFKARVQVVKTAKGEVNKQLPQEMR